MACNASCLQCAGPQVWNSLFPLNMVSAKGATLAPVLDADNEYSVLVSGTAADTDVYTFDAYTDDASVTALRIQVLPDPSLPHNGPGRAPNGNFLLNHVAVSVTTQAGTTVPVAFKSATRSDYEQSGYEVPHVFDDETTSGPTGWSISPHMGQKHTMVLEISTANVCPDNTCLLSVKLSFNYGFGLTLG